MADDLPDRGASQKDGCHADLLPAAQRKLLLPPVPCLPLQSASKPPGSAVQSSKASEDTHGKYMTVYKSSVI